MADKIKKELNLNVELVEGSRGEFSILLNDTLIAQKGWILFPNQNKVVEDIRLSL